MSFDKLEGVIEKFANECLNESNTYKNSKECDKLFKYIQRNLLPEYNKNKTNVGFEPTNANICASLNGN
tara:strand:- start:137 stop:343 length:207 start_codon:yes stop_codon:yes gene_type:complete